MGVSAIICASLCAFFLQEPKGSFGEEYDQSKDGRVFATVQEERF
jgi:MFS transporter, NNP family, nitrate/nitrite transporter